MNLTEYINYLLPILAISLLCAGWMAVQILAKRMKVKNHIDQTSGCCGACVKKETCSKV